MNSPHVLIIVQNLPVPLDRRVWLECGTLTAAGYEVSVICPKGLGDPSYELRDGVHLYKYAPPRQAEGALGFAWEFVYCWVRTAWLSLRVWRRRRFDVLQACNPPDTYWALALLWRPMGVRFVFDHHDLNPEVFLSRFGEPKGLAGRLQLKALRWLERRSFRAAHRVISTNASYQRIAWERGGVAPERTAVVRSGPDTSAMRPVDGLAELRDGGEHLVVYLGIMGPQDGVDGVLDVAERVVHRYGRKDIRFALLGFGDCLENLMRQADELQLNDYVKFTGRVGPDQITAYLSTASVGLSPDPLNPLNDLSTMNKTMEYMAYALPVVAYRLTETVISASECAVYVEPGDVDGFATALLALLDDPEQRSALGAAGRRRAERELDWVLQSQAYLNVFDGLLGRKSRVRGAAADPGQTHDRWGNRLVPLGDDRVLREFAATRKVPEQEEI